MNEQNPFSLYDFLGYLVPGFLSLFIIYAIGKIQANYDFWCMISNINFDLNLIQTIILIVVSYFVGHVLNYLSSVTVEKYSYWKYDYPSKYLMKIQHNYKYFRGAYYSIIWRLIVATMLSPIVIGDYFLGEKLKFKDVYMKSLDQFLIDAIKTKGRALFTKLNLVVPAGRLRDYDYHRVFAHYILQNSETVNKKTSNYVALYGYLRSMCLLLSIGFWIAIYYLVKSVWAFSTFKEYLENQWSFVVFTFSIFLLSYICFMAFMKFYRRYSLENLMAIVTSDL